MNQPTRELNLVDTISLVVGVIIGAGIYSFSSQIASATTRSWQVLALWFAGGCLSLLGALCYAELAAAYPRAGGDYVYLGRAYGSWAGFLFGWTQLTILRPGDIATIALVFAQHATPFVQTYVHWQQIDWSRVLAILAVAALTLIHMLGVRQGKWTQNLLTAAKVIGILIVVCLAFASPHQSVQPAKNPAAEPIPARVALIIVLFCYGGWNEVAYMAGEVRNPQRNVLRGLCLGLLAVTVIYLLMVGAFLHVLGREGLANSLAVAADTVSYALPHYGAALINGLICISTIGTVSGLVFSGSRISYALGTDYPQFRWLGKWAKAGTPRRALILQSALTVALILIFGSPMDTMLATSVAVYIFYTFTCLAVIRLRFKDPATERPYRVTGYPVTVLLFVGVSLLLLYSSVMYVFSNNPRGLVVLASVAVVGSIVFLLEKLYVRRNNGPH